MKFNKVYEESMFVRTTGHSHEIHTEKRNEYADKKMNKKNKSTAPKSQTDDMKDYKKCVKSGKQYLSKVSNIKGKM